MERTKEQIIEQIKRSKRLAHEWQDEAAEAARSGRVMMMDGCVDAANNHRRNIAILETELRSRQ